MRLLDMTCQHCGALLKVDIDKKRAICNHCGATILIDDEIQHIRYDNAEEAGYNFEKGRQRARREEQQRLNIYYNKAMQQRYMPQIPSQQKKKGTCWQIFLWVFFFPIMITIFLVKTDKLRLPVKIVLIVVLWIFFIIIGMTNDNENVNDTESYSKDTEFEIEESNEKENKFPTVSVAEEKDDTIISQEIGKNEFVEYDTLQNLFLILSFDTAIESIDSFISENNLEFTKKEYNGTPKKYVYKIAYKPRVALQRYADSGDYVKVCFSRYDGSLLYAEYFNDSALMVALLYNYGTFWDFRESKPNNTYSGYYYSKPGKYDGVIIEYANGLSTQTSYHECSNAEEALLNVVYPKVSN